MASGPLQGPVLSKTQQSTKYGFDQGTKRESESVGKKSIMVTLHC